MELLGAISRYLTRTGMKPARFGREAIGDPRLVFDMRNGRCPRPATERRIRAFMGEIER